jgi:hypothetical protein
MPTAVRRVVAVDVATPKANDHIGYVDRGLCFSAVDVHDFRSGHVNGHDTTERVAHHVASENEMLARVDANPDSLPGMDDLLTSVMASTLASISFSLATW